MIKKIISFNNIHPVDIFGIHNSKINIINNIHPQVKIIARSNEIILEGPKKHIDNIENAINTLIYEIENNNTVDDNNFILMLENKYHIDKNKHNNIIVVGERGNIVKAKTINQKRLVSVINKCDLIFAIGPAGTGKTYTAVAIAVNALKNKQVKRIILTRPAVETGENLGFLPGDMKNKLDPYLQPLYDALRDMIPNEKLISYIDDGTIQIAPLAYMRGRTLDNSFVILDEAQNTTIGQMKMFLTRMGKYSKFIITGDITQIDLPNSQKSGLIHSIQILKGINGIEFIHFSEQDFVRHPLIADILNAYNNNNNNKI